MEGLTSVFALPEFAQARKIHIPPADRRLAEPTVRSGEVI
jgi:hypothetical protein